MLTSARHSRALTAGGLGTWSPWDTGTEANGETTPSPMEGGENQPGAGAGGSNHGDRPQVHWYQTGVFVTRDPAQTMPGRSSGSLQSEAPAGHLALLMLT